MNAASKLAALLIAGFPILVTPPAFPAGGDESIVRVAIVSDASGEAFTVSPRRVGESPVRVLTELSAGQLLRLEPGCRLVISLTSTGETFELEGGGRFRIEVDTIEVLDRSGRLRAVSHGIGVRMLS